MSLKVDEKKASQIASTLYNTYYSQEGLFGWKGFKEIVIPEDIEKGSGEHIFFITLALIVMDCQKEKKRHWLACKEAFENRETKYLFIPEKIRWNSIKKIMRDFDSYSLSKNPLQDARYWKRIASSMHLFFASDPFRLLEECDYDAQNVLHLIRSYRYRRGFPFLKSRKLAPIWLQLLYEQGGIPIRGMETFPLEVDTHIIRASLNSGAVSGSFQGSLEELKSLVNTIWQEACQKIGCFPLQLKEPLWYLGRYGCRLREGEMCLLSLDCPVKTTCLSHSFLQLKNKVSVQLNH